MPKTRAHIFISGFVQGVGYRFFTILHARKLGVSGFVKNLRDGRVEVVAEGGSENVTTLIKYLKRGPPGANVTNLDVKWEKYRGNIDNFGVQF